MSDDTLPRVAVMGAVAYDVIGKTDKVFDGNGPGLNCKVTAQKEFFGGCAGNIAYGLKLLKTPCLLLSLAGTEDFRRYAQHLNHHLSGVLSVKGMHCAKANIITDPNGTQFTAFSPGPEVDKATWATHLQNQPFGSMDIFVCAPFPIPLMQSALEITKASNPNIFNLWVPGQYADSMQADELRIAVKACDLLVGNAHEIDHIRRTAPGCLTGKSVIETDGARPVRALLSDGNQRTLPTPAVSPVVDPTGCGDAFVAGLIPSLLQTFDTLDSVRWEQKINAIVRAGIQQAGLCLTQRGSQTYRRR